jgi:hypothetical protein
VRKIQTKNMNTTTRAQRINKRQNAIWETYQRQQNTNMNNSAKTNQKGTAAPKAPRYIKELVRAARLVEAHSHYNANDNSYVVDPHAMASLCGAIGNRKVANMEVA